MASILCAHQLSRTIARQCQALTKRGIINKQFLPLLSVPPNNVNDQHISFHSKNMALSLLHDLLADHRRSPLEDLYDQHFGLGLFSDADVFPTSTILVAPLHSGYVRPWRKSIASDSGVSSVHSGKKELSINLDVQQFKPEELKVSLKDGFIVVEGKHEERSDEHGFISREFTRKYRVPEDVDLSTLSSNLSSDGVLQLKAAKKALPEPEGKEIPIVQTNQPAIKKKPDNAEKMEQ